MLPGTVAAHMREAAISAEYPEGGVEHEGATYPGMSLTMGSEHERTMLPLVAKAAGVGAITSRASFFRCMHEGISTGHGHDFRVHYDSPFGEYAFVLHLSQAPHAHGGTAFWVHKGTGALEVAGDNRGALNLDLHSREAWALDALIGVRFNRGVIYPACRIHSAHPNQGWGKARRESRLIWTCLFSVQVARDNKAGKHQVD